VTLSTDRRAALKARHRTAILDAARALAAEKGGTGFGVDELAARADVARRTVFNHFGSLDDVLLGVCEIALAGILDDFLVGVASVPVGDGSRASMFDEITSAMRAADLPAAIAGMHDVLGDPAEADGKAAALTQTAFARVTDQLRDEVVRRHPAADPLDAALLVDSLMSGVVLIAKHWITATGARLDDGSRAEWDALLTRLIDSVRSGYAPTD
jgi:TetR/AcrR family transcriptional regulator, regulator of autoinduction and epiphytic fitness